MNIKQEDLKTAIILFATSKGGNKQELKQLQKYLNDVEKSLEIWEVSQIILSQQNNDNHVYFFCAKFLKNKLIYDHAELNEQQSLSVFKSIVELI